MERLTWRDEIGQALLAPEHNEKYDALELIDILLDRLAAYEDTGLEPQTISEILDSVSEWYDAHKEGRLLVLPCKVGDKVYQTDGIKVYESTVRQLIFDTENIAFDVCAIGKSVFRTSEEAEAKLKEVERDG